MENHAQIGDNKPKSIIETALSQRPPATLHYLACEQLFRWCPFCGENVNVFEVPEIRYGENSPYGWVVECRNMGCIFQRSSPDQSLQHILENWNKRF